MNKKITLKLKLWKSRLWLW